MVPRADRGDRWQQQPRLAGTDWPYRNHPAPKTKRVQRIQRDRSGLPELRGREERQFRTPSAPPCHRTATSRGRPTGRGCYRSSLMPGARVCDRDSYSRAQHYQVCATTFLSGLSLGSRSFAAEVKTSKNASRCENRSIVVIQLPSGYGRDTAYVRGLLC